MRRYIAVLVATLILLGGSVAGASEYTLDEKLQLQLRDGSGLRAEATFEVSQNARMTALDETTNTILNALLAASSLDVRYIRGAGSAKGQEDISVTLLREAQSMATVHFTTDGTLEALTASLLGPQTYASLKGDGLITALITGQGGEWPGIERALWAINGADNEWRSRAEVALRPYLERLTLWLQGHTTAGTITDEDNRSVTQSVTVIPVAALKTQLKTMLAELYRDTPMLSILRQQFSAREAAAYLEPTLLPGLQQTIDALPLVGDLTLKRSYDQQGSVVLDELLLPLAGISGMEQLHYRYTLSPQGERHVAIEATMLKENAAAAQPAVISLAMQGAPLADHEVGMESGAYTGSLVFTKESAAFTVGAQPPREEQRMDFDLTYRVDKESMDAQGQQSTRPFSMELTLTPTGFEGMGPQSIKAQGQFTGSIRSSAATHMTAQAIWQDMSTQGSITINVAARTAAPWAIPTVAGTGALRLDSLSALQLQQQKSSLEQALRDGLAQLTQRYLAPAVPVP